MMNYQNKLIIISSVFLFSLILLTFSYAQTPDCNELTKYTDPLCANWYLENNPLEFDFSQTQSIFSSINQDLITKNIDLYNQYIFNNKYSMSSLEGVTGMQYSFDGKITHPIIGEINTKMFPEGTDFSITKDDVMITIPQGAELNPSNVGKGIVNLEPGSFKLPTGQTIIQDKMIIENGKMFVTPGGSAELNNVIITNTGITPIHISPNTLTEIPNSVSFVNNEVAKLSSKTGRYDLLFKNSGTSFTVGQSNTLNTLSFEEPSIVKDFKTQSQLSTGLMALGAKQALSVDEISSKFNKQITPAENINVLRNSQGEYQISNSNNGEVLNTQSQGTTAEIIDSTNSDTPNIYVGTEESLAVASSEDARIVLAKRDGLTDSANSFYNDLAKLDVNYGTRNIENERQVRQYVQGINPNVKFNRELVEGEWQKTSMSGLKKETLFVSSGFAQSTQEEIYITGAGEERGYNSKHTAGLAIDIEDNAAGNKIYSDWQKLDSESYQKKYGFPKEAIYILDEREDITEHWTGPHYHIEVKQDIIKNYIENSKPVKLA